MAGWINVPVKVETHQRLLTIQQTDGLSFDKVITKLLDYKELHTESPEKWDDTLTELDIVKAERDDLKIQLTKAIH
jgi:hypothetical protein